MLSVRVKIDGPLLFDLTLDTAAIARAMGDAAPKGDHPHDPPGWTTKRGTRPRRGDHRLSNWLGNPRSWNPERFRPNAKRSTSTRLHCTVFLAYALIQDRGGPVPPVGFSYNAKILKRGNKYSMRVMTWQQGGRTVFAVSRKGYSIRPQNYIEKGVTAFLADRHSIHATWETGPAQTYD